MAKRTLVIAWKTVNGAATTKRVLKLKPNADGIYICPTNSCLHVGFKSNRGLRKHINNSHAWYYYFDEQPVVDRKDAMVRMQDKLKSSTHKMPAFSLRSGTGKEFLDWLQTPCGGGKSVREAVNAGRRAMKFLMASLGDAESDSNVNEEYIDCCLGSPAIVINFLKLITEEWNLRSSGSLTYLKAISDLLDFRKAKGVSDDTLRSFTVTEVYIRRGKENLSKKKKLEYARNLDLETLISRNSWASIEEMEEVIPYHTPKYKYVVNKCKIEDGQPSVSELCFATRFIVTFLFLRVKCTRPMSYRFMTIDMFKVAKENGGFIDQTLFKTNDKYSFDTLYLTDDVIAILDTYVETIRPLCIPTCEYVLVTTNGTQYNALGAAMSLLVFQSIGKSINPTRYRQIVETESSIHLTTQERETISKDQKHSSYVAKRSYQKFLSRQVALQGRACMQKIVGTEREQHTKRLASAINCVAESIDTPGPSGLTTKVTTCTKSATETLNIDVVEEVVVDEVEEMVVDEVADENTIGTRMCTTKALDSSSEKSTPIEIPDVLDANESFVNASETRQDIVASNRRSSLLLSVNESDVPTQTKRGNDICLPSSTSENVGENVVTTTNLEELEIKKEELENELGAGTRLRRFSLEEDNSLKEGIRKYGLGKWINILRDKCFSFHQSRTRDSLRVRADTLGLTKKKRKRKKYDTRS